jgi:uncharacterized membrane protein YjjP (DUF1212 family)
VPTAPPADAPGRALTQQEFDSAVRFLSRLARALGAYGAASHRLENVLAVTARDLGLDAQFFAMPTGVFLTAGSGSTQVTIMAPIEGSETNLERLVLLDRVFNDVVANRITPDEGVARIDAIVHARLRYAPAVSILAATATSAAVAVFFSGSWADIGASAVAGLGVGLVAWLVGSMRSALRLVEFASGAVAALLAAALAWRFPGVSTPLVTLAGVISLVPGMMLTTAINELATRHLVSGAARLMGAFMTFISIGFGVAVGARIGAAIPAGASGADHAWALSAPPSWLEAVALIVSGGALTVLFRARPRDVLWVLLASMVGFGGARLGSAWLGPDLGAIVGALAVGLAANAAARALDRPAAVMTAPGILLLVPGSIGYRSFQSLMGADVVGGVQAAFTMLVVAAAIVTGLLVANVLLPPRKAL